MAGFWKGFVSVNDDLRHTYERVFYGRETTENLTANDVPALKDDPASPASRKAEAPAIKEPVIEAPEIGPAPTREPDTQASRKMTRDAYAHAANAPGIRAEMDAAREQPYSHTVAPDIRPVNERKYEASYIDQTATRFREWESLHGRGWQVEAPAIEEPSIQAPEIEAPKIAAPDNDMTPG